MQYQGVGWKMRAVLFSHPLLDESMFVLQLPLLHGRVDHQLVQLKHKAEAVRGRVRLTSFFFFLIHHFHL